MRDVGFGKTEVALRAAFKVVMDGKQVAVLVPTTVLAQQHYKTFLERFKDYPLMIEMLSRFSIERGNKLYRGKGEQGRRGYNRGYSQVAAERYSLQRPGAPGHR